jgi:hypothetical protein
MMQKFCRWCRNPLPKESRTDRIYCNAKCRIKYNQSKPTYKKWKKEWTIKYQNRPEIKKKKREQARKYSKTPEAKRRRKEYEQSPRGREIRRKIHTKYCRKWRVKNREKLREYHRNYQKRYAKTPKGKENQFLINQRRREKFPIRLEIGRDRGLLKKILERDGLICQYCRKPVIRCKKPRKNQKTVDHIDDNGGTDITNLVIACKECNDLKGTKNIFEWFEEQDKTVPKKIIELMKEHEKNGFKLSEKNLLYLSKPMKSS